MKALTDATTQDPTLQRCFGRPEAIVNLDWRDIAPLRTRAPPHLPMPRLDELLAFLVRPENAHVWLLLDIKSDNDADLVMRRIAAAIATVPPLSGRPWHQRILLGVWELGFLPACQRALPLFPISHIGISLSYARRFLDEPSMAALNLFVYALLVPPLGRLLVRRAHRRHKAVFAWTVDEPALLRLCMREGIDGIVTDDPLRVRAERQAWLRAGRRGPVESAYGWRKWVFGTWILCVAWWFTHWFLWTVRREGATRRRRNNPRADAAVEMS